MPDLFLDIDWKYFMDICYGIDGTDNNDTSQIDTGTFDRGGTKGYVKRMVAGSFDRHHYEQGTTYSLLGWDSGAKGRAAADWVRAHYLAELKSGRKLRVFLTGFSRGGASCIYASHLLADDGIEVEGLFLFDAVDKTPWFLMKNNAVIPGNVKNAFHATRSRDGESREGILGFDHCGLQSEGKLTLREFRCTHGGMGGWRFDSDSLVEKPISAALRNQATGLPAALHPRPSWLPADKFIKEPYNTAASTNITLIQQLSTSLTVWNWMSQNMTSTRFQCR